MGVRLINISEVLWLPKTECVKSAHAYFLLFCTNEKQRNLQNCKQVLVKQEF